MSKYKLQREIYDLSYTNFINLIKKSQLYELLKE